MSMEKKAKGRIVIYIPVSCTSKSSKKLTYLDLVSEKELRTSRQKIVKGEPVDIGPYAFENFIFGFPDLNTAKRIVSDCKHTFGKPEYLGLAIGFIEEGDEYLKIKLPYGTVFGGGDITIADQKLAYVIEPTLDGSIDPAVEKDENGNEIYYIFTNEEEDGDGEYSHENRIVYKASQVNSYFSYYLWKNKEEIIKHVEEILVPSLKPGEILRVRKVRIPDCCSIIKDNLSEFDMNMKEVIRSNGVIPGEIVYERKAEIVEESNSELSELLRKTEWNKNKEPIELSEEDLASIAVTLDDKKSTTEYVAYNSHKMLNPPYLTATSGITCIDSYQMHTKKMAKEWEEEAGYRDLLVEIMDCRGKIRLHNRGGDLEDFKKKITVLRDELNSFLDHLEATPTPKEVVKKAIKLFPDIFKK